MPLSPLICLLEAHTLMLLLLLLGLIIENTVSLLSSFFILPLLLFSCAVPFVVFVVLALCAFFLSLHLSLSLSRCSFVVVFVCLFSGVCLK